MLVNVIIVKWISLLAMSILMLFFFLIEQVALKTLIVVHRLLREGDPTFREELLNFSQRGRVLQLSNFKDDSSPIGKSLVPSTLLFLISSLLYSLSLLWSHMMINFLCNHVISHIKFYNWNTCCSLGLLCLGSYLCTVLGGKTSVLQSFKIWYWSWAFTKTCPGAGEGDFYTLSCSPHSYPPVFLSLHLIVFHSLSKMCL